MLAATGRHGDNGVPFASTSARAAVTPRIKHLPKKSTSLAPEGVSCGTMRDALVLMERHMSNSDLSYAFRPQRDRWTATISAEDLLVDRNPVSTLWQVAG